MATNTATIILLTYMSVMFSKPLNGYWANFLLVYRIESLDLALLPQGKDMSETERARRYNEKAVKDANRQITIMMAFVKTSDIEGCHLSTNEAVPLLTTTIESLTSQERRILADSCISGLTETSDELFERVRREAAHQRRSQSI